MTVVRDGTSTFKGDVVSEVLDEVTLWHHTSLPTGGAAEPPAGALFLLEADDGDDVAGIYENTGTRASPTWVLRFEKPNNVLKTPVSLTTAHRQGHVVELLGVNGLLYDSTGTTNQKKFRRLTDDTIQAYVDNFIDYADDTAFDADWVTSEGADINPSAANDRIDATLDNGASDNSVVYFDLGAGNVSDTAWVLRFQIQLTSYTGATTTVNQLFGIELADTTSNNGVTRDLIAFFVSAYSGHNAYKITDGGVGTVASAGGTAFTTDTPGVETRWVELKRTSSTTYDARIYSDSTYTTLTDSLTGQAVTAITGGFRYLKIITEDTSTSDGTIIGSINDVQFYNGITSV